MEVKEGDFLTFAGRPSDLPSWLIARLPSAVGIEEGAWLHVVSSSRRCVREYADDDKQVLMLQLDHLIHEHMRVDEALLDGKGRVKKGKAWLAELCARATSAAMVRLAAEAGVTSGKWLILKPVRGGALRTCCARFA